MPDSGPIFRRCVSTGLKILCPNCQKTGRAKLSQTDDQSGDIEAELVPAGFKVIQLEHSITFHCASCDVASLPHWRAMSRRRSTGT
jgi:hypothetical protein